MHQVTGKVIADILGWLGALLFLVSYFLLVIKRWKSTSFNFHICNILGGFFVGISALYDLSFPSAFINFAWGFIALYGMYNDQLK